MLVLHQLSVEIPLTPFFHQHTINRISLEKMSNEKNMMPVVLSVIEPYNIEFTTTNNHLPQLLPTIYNPANLKKSYTKLIEMANNVAKMTFEQSKSKQRFLYRDGKITASWCRQVLHTDPHKPSLSLISNICYPDVHSFSNEATQWGSEQEMVKSMTV